MHLVIGFKYRGGVVNQRVK